MVRSTNGGMTVIIDGNGNDRIFDLLANAADLALSDITLRNGDAQGGDGGAILNIDNTVTLTDVRLTGNTANRGGAVFVSTGDAQLDVNRALFDNNTASEGGAIFGTDPGIRLNITNATFTGNTGTSKGGAMRVNYVRGSYPGGGDGPNRGGNGGNFELDTFRVNLDYRQGPVLGKAEYRFYDGYHFIHTGGLSTLCRRHRSAQAFPLRWYC